MPISSPCPAHGVHCPCDCGYNHCPDCPQPGAGAGAGVNDMVAGHSEQCKTSCTFVPPWLPCPVCHPDAPRNSRAVEQVPCGRSCSFNRCAACPQSGDTYELHQRPCQPHAHLAPAPQAARGQASGPRRLARTSTGTCTEEGCSRGSRSRRCRWWAAGWQAEEGSCTFLSGIL